MSPRLVRDLIAIKPHLEEMAAKEKSQFKRYTLNRTVQLLKDLLADGDDETCSGCTDD